MTFAMILDLVVVVLLVPTIIFAVILNNRLSILRRNREELARLIAAFNEATVRAESGIPRLKKTSEDASRSLQEKVERAQVLRDDLAFLIERAEGMAGRLESVVRDARVENVRSPVRGSSSPLANGLDIESAAEAAERAERATQERTRVQVADSDRIGIDRAALERMVEERGGLALGGEDRIAPPSRRPAPDRSSRASEDLSPEHALAERILAEQAGQDFSAPAPEGRRLRESAGALPAPTPRSAPKAPPLASDRSEPRDRLAETDPRERPLTRASSGTRPADRPSVAPARTTRPGQVLGSALVEETQTRAPSAPAGRPAASRTPPSAPAGGTGVGKDDDDRSEAERELLRALRSAR